MNVFPKDQFLVFQNEEYRTRPLWVMEKVVEFLNTGMCRLGVNLWMPNKNSAEIWPNDKR